MPASSPRRETDRLVEPANRNRSIDAGPEGTAGPASHGVLMTTGSSSKAGPTHKLVEAGITLLITLFGVVVIVGSVKAGINWGAEGPRAGFFPFYIGIFIVVSSAINLWNGLREDN